MTTDQLEMLPAPPAGYEVCCCCRGTCVETFTQLFSAAPKVVPCWDCDGTGYRPIYVDPWKDVA